MSGITTHVLDLARGCPAAGVAVRLERAAHASDGIAAVEAWIELAATATDGNGRTGDLTGGTLEAGVHRLLFATGAYFEGQGIASFHPAVEIRFTVADPNEHHHVPLLVAPFGYSTYRGS